MLSRQSETCVRKSDKKPIIRFYPVIRLVVKKGSGNGAPGPHGKGRKRGGPLKSGEDYDWIF